MSVNLPEGFLAGGFHCGIKAEGVFDLSLVTAKRPVVAAGVFTRNVAAAAPVQLSRTHLANGYARAVVLNSGCANAGTGATGEMNAARMATATAGALGCAVTDVLVCSTGPIGPQLPIDAIKEGIAELAGNLGDDPDSGLDAARGIMTTDTRPKTAAFTDPAGWSIGGMAKGAAMIRPDMATMLAVLTTDAAIVPEQAAEALARAVATTFNSVNIDGCTSTNDTVLLFASGDSGCTVDTVTFSEALTGVCESLARQMAADGEETTRVVDVVVTGAADDTAAHRMGLEVTDSDLVRSSFYGGDPNWGRVLQALGQSGIEFDPRAVEVAYEDVVVATDGVQASFDRAELRSRLLGDFTLTVRVGEGAGRARIITTDLTPGYVQFNGEPS